MRYSLWSRDRLLGESDLDYDTGGLPGFRMGELTPTPLGDQLLPVVTNVTRVLLEARRARRRAEREGNGASDPSSDERMTTEWADLQEAAAHAEGLELQLRAPDGTVVPTEHIGVQDCEYLAAVGEEAVNEELEDFDPEVEAAVAHDLALIEEWDQEREPEGLWAQYDGGRPPVEERPFPRYQIMVQLVIDVPTP